VGKQGIDGSHDINRYKHHIPE